MLTSNPKEWSPSTSTDSVHYEEARRRDRRASAASPTLCTSTSTLAGSSAISATNPDFGATFPQALTIANHTAIPITDADFTDPNHIQVIANIAAFHFGSIEQGGSSLYAALGRKASSLEVLKITQGIGGDEIAPFLEWVDFVGNGVPTPVAPVTDPKPVLRSLIFSSHSTQTRHPAQPTQTIR
jgi:hypothetical protein